jgi:hypothetical protein
MPDIDNDASLPASALGKSMELRGFIHETVCGGA